MTNEDEFDFSVPSAKAPPMTIGEPYQATVVSKKGKELLAERGIVDLSGLAGKLMGVNECTANTADGIDIPTTEEMRKDIVFGAELQIASVQTDAGVIVGNATVNYTDADMSKFLAIWGNPPKVDTHVYDEWIEEHFNFIPDVPLEKSGTWYLGATTLAAICCASKHSSALVEYATYRDLVARQEATDQMRRGLILEDAVAKMYSEKYGHPVWRAPKIVRHPLYPYLGVSPDFLTLHPEYGICTLDAKTHRWNMKADYGEEWTQGIPPHEQVQGVWQADLLKTNGTIFPVAFGIDFDDLYPYFIPSNPEFAEQIAIAGNLFVHNHLLPGIPPEPGGTPPDSEIVKRLYRNPLETSKVADDEANEWVGKLLEARAATAKAEEEENKWANLLKNYMGDDADTLIHTFGKPITWKKSSDSKKTDWQAVAKDLKAPAGLIEKCTKVVEGTRRFLVPK